jgi:hypothetical protein
MSALANRGPKLPVETLTAQDAGALLRAPLWAAAHGHPQPGTLTVLYRGGLRPGGASAPSCNGGSTAAS